MHSSYGSGLHPDNSSRSNCVLDSTTTTNTMDGVSAKEPDRRRSSRRDFKIFVRVYGRTLNGTAFYENARTINVSVHGALLLMTAAVSKGQKLLLFNEATQRQQMCQIVDVRPGEMELHEVALAFPTPHAEFWNAS